jgi:hypothetical protein
LTHQDPEARIASLNMDKNDFVADDFGKNPRIVKMFAKRRAIDYNFFSSYPS